RDWSSDVCSSDLEAEPSERLRYSLNLEQVAFAAHHGVPAAAGVAGRVDGDLLGGELRLDSQDFMLHLLGLLPEAWRYRRAQGSLAWRFDDEGVRLWSPYALLERGDGRLAS